MRAQSHVVGATLMLGLAIVALGTLTLGVGTVLESQAASADAERVATAMDDGLQGVERTGTHSHKVTFSEGRLSTEERTLRVLKDGTVVRTVSVDVLVFEGNDRRVAALAGAVIRGEGESAWLVSEPPITHSEATDVLVVGAPALGADDVAVSGQGGVTTTLQTNVSHTDYDLGTGEYAVAIETETPDPFERYFAAQNATTTRRTFQGDQTESVVAAYPGQRRGYLVVHDLSLEVENA